MMGYGFGWLSVLVLLLVVLAGAGMLVVLLRPQPPAVPPPPAAGSPDAAEQTLRARLASGEIDEAEYEHRLQVLRRS